MSVTGQKLWQGAVVGAAAFLLAVILAQFGVVERFEQASWNWRAQSLAQPGRASDQVRLILLDQASLDWAADENGLPWPWPRQAYVPILQFLQRAGARAVIFDMLFTEASQFGVDDDQFFAEAIAASGNFVGAVMLGQGRRAVSVPAGARPLAKAAIPTTLLKLSNLHSDQLTLPIAAVSDNAARLGNVFAVPDGDAIFRRVAPLRFYAKQPLPSLGYAAYLLESGIQSAIQLPLDRSGRVILRYRSAGVYPAVSAAAVIQSELRMQMDEAPTVDLALFKDKVVFFAPSAPGLHDLGATPISPTAPRVVVHATLFDNLMSGDLMRDVPMLVAYLYALFLGVVVGMSVRMIKRASQNLLLLMGVSSLVIGASFAAYAVGYWLPLILPMSVVVLAFMGAVLVSFMTEGRQRRFIKQAFQQYLSPAFIETLLNNPERLALGGEERELTIYFSDIQGFTGISESLTPQRLTALLNRYLSEMSDIIMSHGGTIDKFEGDAIIAFWNAPLPQPDHAERGVRAMLECQRRLAELRPELEREYGKQIYARIGMNSGTVVVGNMGSRQRFDYTFLGDAGNLAARLEGVNKVFGSYLLISQATRDQLPADIRCREVGRVGVVGRAKPVTVFEPLLPTSSTAESTAFDEALKCYYQGNLVEAQLRFDALSTADPVAAAYAQRCRSLGSNVGGAWDGVWRLTEK